MNETANNAKFANQITNDSPLMNADNQYTTTRGELVFPVFLALLATLAVQLIRRSYS